MKTREEIVKCLAKYQQRATYGALGGVINRQAIGVMNGLPKNKMNSWIVAKKNGLPSGYKSEEVDSSLKTSSKVINSSDDLSIWLKTHQ